ncbi:HAMP domain-containing sensor histidine kinase [Nocardioides sp. GY 10127]|uniref:sensor histidine kinase n=1 Tax=Nocardioides sp. GY 10127 TaxID=2569762 RepID=UPI0010A7B3FF|nr:HAMP domain-containing sensor histidine kinase [Nocardioides sp. GY 10127]TIC84463.1 HAMP domain-containing histidine kinase [Nocardioides sp. GY 10127]
MRRRISWLVVATTSAVVVSFVVPLCLLVATLAEDRGVAAAEQEARNVALLLPTLDDDTQVAEMLGGLAADGPTTSVLTASGTQLGGGATMTGAEVERALAGAAFRVQDDAGVRVYQPVLTTDGTSVVRTTVTTEQLHQGVTQAWIGIVSLGLLLMAASVAIAMRLGRRISRPLLSVATTAHRLREGDLSARAEVVGTEETQELARALNGLAERTTELLAHERAAVGDLSHRLRTPVTALRLDAEQVADPELADRLQEHIAVLQRGIDAVVAEARRPVRTDLAARCDAVSVVRERLAFWGPLAEDQARPLDVTLPDGTLADVKLPGVKLWVPLPVDDLRDLLDVLLDNVFAHTPDGTALRVAVSSAVEPGGGEAVRIEVADDGPGFSPVREERPGSTGLGLDLAGRTAASVGGRLVRLPGPGAVVHVVLPRLPG